LGKRTTFGSGKIGMVDGRGIVDFPILDC